jgi:hypothetical protein
MKDLFGSFLLSCGTILILILWIFPILTAAPLVALLFVWFIAAIFTVILIRCWFINFRVIKW